MKHQVNVEIDINELSHAVVDYVKDHNPKMVSDISQLVLEEVDYSVLAEKVIVELDYDDMTSSVMDNIDYDRLADYIKDDLDISDYVNDAMRDSEYLSPDGLLELMNQYRINSSCSLANAAQEIVEETMDHVFDQAFGGVQRGITDDVLYSLPSSGRRIIQLIQSIVDSKLANVPQTQPASEVKDETSAQNESKTVDLTSDEIVNMFKAIFIHNFGALNNGITSWENFIADSVVNAPHLFSAESAAKIQKFLKGDQ